MEKFDQEIPGRKFNQEVPGVGSYDPNFSNKKSTPNNKIGTSVREKRGSDVPGVGSYNTNANFFDRERSPSYKYGTGLRKVNFNHENNPGPGTYEQTPQQATKLDAPQFSFRGVNIIDVAQIERDKIPGAGTYNP